MQAGPRYRIGDRIGGRYLVKQFAAGGMGEVYLCEDTGNGGNPMALKTFQQPTTLDPSRRRNFYAEVGHWIGLGHHPHVVTCYTMEEFDHQPFLALECVLSQPGRGVDLRSWLRGGALGQQRALQFTIDVCRGLDHAHRRAHPLIHCDLKPDNVLVGAHEEALITDFGLARMAGTSIHGGTPPYMAPEQWHGTAVDARTDLYALGCMIYELLAGTPPFIPARDQRDPRKWASLHLTAPIPTLPGRDQFTARLNSLVARCLAKVPRDRFATAGDLLTPLSDLYRVTFGAEPRTYRIVNNETAAEHGHRAKTYAMLGRHQEAEAEFARARAIDPADPFTYCNWGASQALQGRYQEALANFNRALALDGRHISTYLNRGNVYQDLQDYTRAQQDYKQVLALDPTYALAHSNLGNLYIARDEHQRALDEFSAAIRLDPGDAQNYHNRGATYAAMGNYVAAIADYNRALEVDPLDVTSYAARGAAYDNMQRREDALSDFTQALQIDPTYERAYLHRSNIYYQRSQHKEALADLERLLEINPRRSAALEFKGMICSELGRYDEAETAFMTEVQVDPASPSAHFNLAVLYTKRQWFSSALPPMQEAAQLGHPEAQRLCERLMQDVFHSFAALRSIKSLAEMRHALRSYAVLQDPEYLSTLEQFLAAALAPAERAAYAQGIAWLRQARAEV